MMLRSFQRFAALLCSLFVFASLWMVSAAQSYPPAFRTTSSYAIGDQVQLNGNVLRCVHAVTPGGFKYSEWELWEVRANTVCLVGVGQTFTSLTTAWNFALNARIAQGAYLHFYIDTVKGNFSESFTQPFNLDHPFGASISLLGDVPSNISLSFSNSNGFSIDNNHAFGQISGIALNGGYSGIACDRGAEIADISNCTLSGFTTGVFVERAGDVVLEPNVSIVKFGVGIECDMFGRIYVPETGTPLTLDAGGRGSTSCVQSQWGGNIYANAIILKNANDGIYATSGGRIFSEFSAFQNVTNPVIASQKVFVDVYGSDVSGSTIGATVSTGAVVNAQTSNFGTLTNTIDTGFGSYLYL